MLDNTKLGRKGEEIAFLYLLKKGYKILDRNWRNNHLELDMVAMENNQLVIVEVKTRSAPIYEVPRDSITVKKIKRIVNAAEAYIMEKNIDLETRFDVISIKWFEEGKYEIDHIVDAFFPEV